MYNDKLEREDGLPKPEDGDVSNPLNGKTIETKCSTNMQLSSDENEKTSWGPDWLSLGSKLRMITPDKIQSKAPKISNFLIGSSSLSPMKPKRRRSKIYISSQNSKRTVQSQPEFSNSDAIHYEEKSIKSHPHFVADLDSKYPSKKSLCATPTLTASLSSSMSNNSGNTVSLDPNRFNDVQHWNADDGPFDISVSPSCTFESQDDSEHDNEVTDSNSQLLGMENSNFEKLREVLLDSDDDSSVDSRFSNRNYVFQHLSHKNGNDLRDESKIKTQENSNNEDRNEIFGLSIPILSTECKKQQGSVESSVWYNPPLHSDSSNIAMELISDSENMSVDFAHNEIKVETKESTLSELSLTPIHQRKQLNHLQYRKNLPGDSSHDEYYHTSGMHRRTGIQEHELQNTLAHTRIFKKSDHVTRQRQTSNSKRKPKNITKRSFGISFIIWMSLILLTVIGLIRVSLIADNAEKFLPMAKGPQSHGRDQFHLRAHQSNVPSLQNMQPIVDVKAIEDKEYSVFLSNQQKGDNLPNGIVETLNHLLACPNVKNLYIDLDKNSVNSIWTSTKHLSEKSEKIKLVQESSYSAPTFMMETEGVFLLDIVSGVYSCRDMDQAYQIWKENSNRLVGFVGLRQNSSSDDPSGISLTKIGQGDGNYNIVSTSGAFVHREYIRALRNQNIFSCHGMGLSIFITANCKLPPIQMNGKAVRFTWDGLLSDTRDLLEMNMLESGKHCVNGVMDKLNLKDLPMEEYSYIGVAS